MLRLVLILVVFPFLSWAQEEISKQFYVKVKPGYTNRLFKISENSFPAFEIPTVNRVVKAKNSRIASATSPFFKIKNGLVNTIYRVEVTDSSQLLEILEALKEDPSIEYAEPVPLRSIISTPNDPSYGAQWHLEKIKAKEAWQVAGGKRIIKVAVVDNAIDTDHEDLLTNMLPGYDVADNDTDPNPPNSTFDHGTHVAGIVAATTNNALGISSVGNNWVKVIPVKATRDISNNRVIDSGYEGIVWAADNGADIISLSWGGSGFFNAELDVINYARSKGALIVAAAGNENSSTEIFPASYDGVISVAALDDTDIRSSFSSYGEKVDISAPGRSILSTIPNNLYTSFSGTSMATPLVSGAAAYLLAAFIDLPKDSVEIILKKTADNIDAQNPNFIGQLGAGRLNLLKAVACKNENLLTSILSIEPDPYFCDGDTTSIALQGTASETYTWFQNGMPLTESSSTLKTKEAGTYVVQRNKGACSIDSDPIVLVENTVKTSPPASFSLIMPYCTDSTVQLSPLSCIGFEEKKFSYSGPTVGFDGLEQSGPNLYVEVSNLPGRIDNVKVGITWQKKDGGAVNTCSMADGGGTPFNEEVSFALKSPWGITIPLVNRGTYARGTKTSGRVTTIFEMGASIVAVGSLPTNGTFNPAGDLGQLKGLIPAGKWELLASDDAFLDPLCVSGFDLWIKPQEPVAGTAYSWFNASNELLQNGSSFTFNANSLMPDAIQFAAQCEGMCPSAKVTLDVTVLPVPQLFAFKREHILLNTSQENILENAQSLEVYQTSTGLIRVRGIDQNSQAFDFQVSNQAPLSSPVSLCSSSDLGVFALGCNGTVSWSNGDFGPGVYLENVSDYTLTATCNQIWDCTPLSNIAFEIKPSTATQVITGILGENTIQDFFGDPLISTQKLLSGSSINYSAPSSILLNPGFSIEKGAVLQIEIKACP